MDKFVGRLVLLILLLGLLSNGSIKFAVDVSGVVQYVSRAFSSLIRQTGDTPKPNPLQRKTP